MRFVISQTHTTIQMPMAGWDQECFQAARDRYSRRLGDSMRRRWLHAAANRNDERMRLRDGMEADIVRLDIGKPSRMRWMRAIRTRHEA